MIQQFHSWAYIQTKLYFKKLKIELPYDPATPLLGIYLDKTIIQNDTCTPMFTVAHGTIPHNGIIVNH